MNNDFLFRGGIDDLDPAVAELIRHETERQQEKLILIPSESTVPYAVRHALSSAFHNIYAEGYPLESTRAMSQSDILDYPQRLPEFRRKADLRYYKGTEYANMVESLARRRAAELFAANGCSADQLFVNVQPLSGAPANSAAYTALLDVGDTVMGMDLIMGGHLTHGSPANRSGKFYNIVSYGIDPTSERIDYDNMRELALQHKPRLIIGGFSSYPFAADWQAYREIADSVGAYLLADVAHVAGLIAAGAYPSPVGIADVVSFTTHKTLNGPRGAVLITHRKDLARKLDRAVFPGEQGGPHINSIAALAVSLRLATSDQFKQLQRQTVAHAARLADKLRARGWRIPYGGTDTHLLLVDCKTRVGADGTALSGDMAARILDLAGIVVNRQTIPGDTSAFRPSGIRLGTTWITQRGIDESGIDQLGDIIADLLDACEPYRLMGRIRPLARAKVDFAALLKATRRCRELSASLGIDTDHELGRTASSQPDEQPEAARPDRGVLQILGARAADFLHGALTSDVDALNDGGAQATSLLEPDGALMAAGTLQRVSQGEFRLQLRGNITRASAWLAALSDGYVRFDPDDVSATLPGPVSVSRLALNSLAEAADVAAAPRIASKIAFIGINRMSADRPGGSPAPRPAFEPNLASVDMLLQTPLHGAHRELGAKLAPFAGYEMPLWYQSVSAEHAAVRESAGVFDVAHMGVLEVSGRGAARFLHALTTNDVLSLRVGRSQYSFLLDVDGGVLDDLLIYRLADERFLTVVNASNNDKIWAWLTAAHECAVMLDRAHPERCIEGRARVQLRDLRAESSGSDRRVDIALQGPRSRHILQSLLEQAGTPMTVTLPWSAVMTTARGWIISRTGYTGERVAYELFVPPDEAADIFQQLVGLGAAPCGLAARDSLRIEAGLPLYGHELAGDMQLNPADAGFGSYVKLHKPFFVGKGAFIERERARKHQVSRFVLDARGGRPAQPGDPVVNTRGRVVGTVTSCAGDAQGNQVGLALMDRGSRKVGTRLEVYAGSARARGIDASKTTIGTRLPVPQPLRIVSRFPKRG
ncbi:MAG: glycine cleavage system aminomethyltransferase GcvT [Chloroflexi bacterium]|nr:glycine cleavage system aminomethyltransferase GcvT [Chloroflexota bacterium]